MRVRFESGAFLEINCLNRMFAVVAQVEVHAPGMRKAVSSNLTCGLSKVCPARIVVVQAHRRRLERSSILRWGFCRCCGSGREVCAGSSMAERHADIMGDGSSSLSQRIQDKIRKGGV